MSDLPNQLSSAAIEAEYRRYRADEDMIHNRELHQRLLTSWEQNSPKMWANLLAQGLTEKMAFVAQERMWRRQDELMSQGMPLTDAREQAEREELLLEPESEPDAQPTPAEPS